jgi:hypothetical protein
VKYVAKNNVNGYELIGVKMRDLLRWLIGWPVVIVLVGLGLFAWFWWWLFGVYDEAEESLEFVSRTWENIYGVK